MKAETIKKFILPPGPILSLTLIGLLLLSAVLYYRATKIQRFLEPALAVSEPRIKFTQSMNALLSQEFGAAKKDGIIFRAGSIFIDESLLFDNAHSLNSPDAVIMKKLSRFFLSAFNDPAIRNNISLVLICTRVPLGSDSALNKGMRFSMQERSLSILNALYAADPELAKNFGTYFAATAMSVNDAATGSGSIEFRIVPTEILHIEVLQRLMKYMQ